MGYDDALSVSGTDRRFFVLSIGDLVDNRSRTVKRARRRRRALPIRSIDRPIKRPYLRDTWKSSLCASRHHTGVVTTPAGPQGTTR